MTIFTIDTDNNITAHSTPEEAAATTAAPFDSFASQQELASLGAGWPAERLVAIWNSLPGVTPVEKFKNRPTAATRIWKSIQELGGVAKPELAQRVQPITERKAKGATHSAKGAPATAKANKEATPAKNAPKGKTGAKTLESTAPREGSKTAQVVIMLQRRSGATLSEIMTRMGWQKHTVRGFMAGAMKKAGFTIESFKPEGGERTYRINK